MIFSSSSPAFPASRLASARCPVFRESSTWLLFSVFRMPDATLFFLACFLSYFFCGVVPYLFPVCSLSLVSLLVLHLARRWGQASQMDRSLCPGVSWPRPQDSGAFAVFLSWGFIGSAYSCFLLLVEDEEERGRFGWSQLPSLASRSAELDIEKHRRPQVVRPSVLKQ